MRSAYFHESEGLVHFRVEAFEKPLAKRGVFEGISYVHYGPSLQDRGLWQAAGRAPLPFGCFIVLRASRTPVNGVEPA
ncbi:hypothetical protein DSM101010T_00090 [Desulfovibrio subterraneus]|uniref:Uncharacterized protein n=1 Tax=Desulfovibrio subterraneus TaxID=2718620 RepID=A0A7J0BEL8_9BACT|nr:hypothetical protein DSM101010T_00090 [Desulfovibrio subterraneus]